jgi:uncharacterized Zn-binding protein involved in type VI secretion
MSKAARANTTDKAGGLIQDGASKVNIDGLPAAREGDPVQAHGDSPHAKVTISKKVSSKVRIEGKFAARAGDTATCGHPITGGSDSVNIG